MKVSIIVPTYNERENLEILVKRIASSLGDKEYEIIIVDDNSPDGTWRLAQELARFYPIKLIKREEKRGLASAVVDGFSHAAGHCFVVMDADLQHPPEAIPRLIEAIENGADLAVASRYIEGGSVRGWSFFRRFVSRGATWLARLFLTNVKDPMSGFFALRREVVEGADLRPEGYKILLEILVKGNYARVAEIPYTFEPRKLGRSKLKGRQYIQYLKHLISLMRYKGELKRLLKFAIVGASGILVNEGLLFILTETLNIHYLLSAFLSIECAILSNFILNDLWTFKDRRDHGVRGSLKRAIKSNLGFGAGVLINLLVLFMLTEFTRLHYLISNFFGILVAFIWNFLISIRWIWKINSHKVC